MAKTSENKKDSMKKTETDHINKMRKIDKKLDVMQDNGLLPFMSVHIIRGYGPSLLNRGENGKQKTITVGGVERMLFSSASKKRPVRKEVFKELMHTKAFNLLLRDRFVEEYPEYNDAAIRDLIGDAMEGAFKGSILSVSEAEIKTSCNAIKNVIDKIPADTLKTEREKKGKSDKLNKYIEDIKNAVKADLKPLSFDQILNNDIAEFGRMSTDDCFRTVYGAVLTSHGYGVTPFFNEKNDFVAVDDYLETLRRLGSKEAGQGAAHMDSKDVNSAIMLEQYIRSPRVSLRNIMEYGLYDPEKEEDWAKAIEISNKNGALLFDAFTRLVPTGASHDSSTRPEYLALLVRVTNQEPITADAQYQKAIRGDNSVQEAVDRLAAFAGSRNADSPYLKRKSFWSNHESVTVPEKYRTAWAGDNVEECSIKEICAKIENGLRLD